MSIGWFIVPYKRDLSDSRPARYCAMHDANDVIVADGGEWTETEILHTAIPIIGDVAGKAIVKVRANNNTLSDLATVYRRIPKNVLDDSLSDLTNQQKTAIRNELEDCGYTLQEIQNRFGNDIGGFTLKNVLQFASSRRLKSRYDSINNRIICDGKIQPCRDLIDVDQRTFNDVDIARLINLRNILINEWNTNQQLIRLSQRLPLLPDWEKQFLLVLCGQAGYRFDRIRPDTFPTTGVLDTFTQGDGPLSGSWTGATWDADSPVVLSNQTMTFVSASAHWNVSNFTDSEAYLTVATKPLDGNTIYVFARTANEGETTLDAYSLRYQAVAGAGNDIWRVRRIDNGGPVTLGADITQELAAGEKLGLEIVGSTITVYYYNGSSWSSLGTRSDATYASGHIGMAIYDTTFRGDDFSGGTVVSGGAVKDINRNIVRGAFRGIGRGIA